MRKPVVLIFSVWMMLVFIPGGLNGQTDRDIEVKASIGADKIGTDDVLVYTVTLKNINNPAPPNVSHFKDFRVGQTSHGSEFQSINGVASFSTNFMFYLVPLRTGTLTLPPVTYEYQGKKYQTQTFTVEVVKGSIAPPGTPGTGSQPRGRSPFSFDRDDEFFSSPFRKQRQPQEIDVKVIPEVSKKTAVVGEPIIYKVFIYTRNSVRGFNLVSNPSIPGFWQEVYPAPKSFNVQRKMINGKEYTIAEILKIALFPTRSGSIAIPSLKFELGLEGSDPFSILSNSRAVERSTPEVTVNISAPPPDALGLPVGHFQMDVAPQKKQVDINDILTLKIKISGIGNAKTLNVPEFQSSDYFKVYPSKISRGFDYQSDPLSGFVEAEVPVSFKKTGLISFPSLESRYFDPGASRVVSLRSQPFVVQVTGLKEKEDTAVTIPESEIIKTGEDIDFIKKGKVYNQDKNFYQNNVYILLLLIPFGINLFFLFKVLVYDRFISQSPLLKQKKLLNRTLKSLKKVRDYGEISPVLENYLKAKTGLGLSEINNRAIEQLLVEKRVLDTDIDEFIRVKSGSESSRFSPDKAAVPQGERLNDEVNRIIEILKRIDGKIK